MPKYRNDLFVEYLVTPKRIKGFFGRLQKYKSDNPADLGEDGVVPDHAVGPGSSTAFYMHPDGRQIKGKSQLQAEVRSRNIQVRGLSTMKNEDLVETLVQNDHERKHGGVDGASEEDFALALATVEAHNGGLNCADETFGENDEKEEVKGDDIADTEVELMNTLLQE